jgi:hypothetical protein
MDVSERKHKLQRYRSKRQPTPAPPIRPNPTHQAKCPRQTKINVPLGGSHATARRPKPYRDRTIGLSRGGKVTDRFLQYEATSAGCFPTNRRLQFNVRAAL